MLCLLSHVKNAGQPLRSNEAKTIWCLCVMFLKLGSSTRLQDMAHCLLCDLRPDRNPRYHVHAGRWAVMSEAPSRERDETISNTNTLRFRISSSRRNVSWHAPYQPLTSPWYSFWCVDRIRCYNQGSLQYPGYSPCARPPLVLLYNEFSPRWIYGLIHGESMMRGVAAASLRIHAD